MPKYPPRAVPPGLSSSAVPAHPEPTFRLVDTTSSMPSTPPPRKSCRGEAVGCRFHGAATTGGRFRLIAKPDYAHPFLERSSSRYPGPIRRFASESHVEAAVALCAAATRSQGGQKGEDRKFVGRMDRGLRQSGPNKIVRINHLRLKKIPAYY